MVNDPHGLVRRALVVACVVLAVVVAAVAGAYWLL